MEGALNACAVVCAKVTDQFDNGCDVIRGDFRIREWLPNLVRETYFDFPAEIEDDFYDARSLRVSLDGGCDIGWQDVEEEIQIVGRRGWTG